jgi:hypothetical protein
MDSLVLKAPPVNLIPAEILCDIFALLVPVQTSTSPAIPTLGPQHRKPWILGGPWVLGHICSHWRAIAVSLPILWTSITVANNLSAREFSLLNTQFARTGSAPINLLIRFTSGAHTRQSERLFDQFLLTLVSHSIRWRTLHLFDALWHPHAAFGPLGPRTLPVLEELVFSGAVGFLSQYKFFKDAPVLRRVVLGSPGGSWVSDTLLPLPWAQLTTYKATYLDTGTHFRNLAAAATNLVECDITVTGRIGLLDVRSHAVLTLWRLRRLTLSNPMLLERLTAPALQSLYIVGPVDDVLPFLQRSKCTPTLTELTLAECPSHAREVVALLRHTSALTTLALHLHSPCPAVVAALAAPVHLCPNLGSLAWVDFDFDNDREAFADMVVSRCGESTGVRPLHFVAHYGGGQRLKRAWRMRTLPGLEVLILNSKMGRPAVARWRAY